MFPAPMRIHLHRGAALPARSDLIAAPLLKPEHICLVIIKSWGGGTTTMRPAPRRRHAGIASTRTAADGAIEAAPAPAPREGGGCTPSISSAPLCSPQKARVVGGEVRYGDPIPGGGSPMRGAGVGMVWGCVLVLKLISGCLQGANAHSQPSIPHPHVPLSVPHPPPVPAVPSPDPRHSRRT